MRRLGLEFGVNCSHWLASVWYSSGWQASAPSRLPPGRVRTSPVRTNVETLAGGHWYRIPTTGPDHRIRGFPAGSWIPNELHQPPLYYLLLAGWQRLIGKPSRAVNPGPASFFALAQRHGLYPHHSAADHRFLLLLRLPNVVLGLLTIWITFLTARLLSHDPWVPVLAAALVAFMPRFVFSTAFVTNDNLVNALGAGLAYVAGRASMVRTARWMAAVGAVVGLLAVTKLSALPAIIVLIPLVLPRRGWISRIKLVAAAIMPILLIAGWYFVQNQVRYGEPLAATASSHYLAPIGGLGSFGPYVVHDSLRLLFASVPSRIFTRFWYEPIFSPFHWSPLASTVFWVGFILSRAGLLRPHIARRRPADFRGQLIVLITLVVAAFASVWIVAFNTAAYDPRLALLGLPPLACLAAIGLGRWGLRFAVALPLIEFAGTLVAMQQTVLGVPRSHSPHAQAIAEARELNRMGVRGIAPSVNPGA